MGGGGVGHTKRRSRLFQNEQNTEPGKALQYQA
jgi:hypothetical protein